MKLLVDMNLTPQWVKFLHRHGFEAEHWSTIGNPRATDREIMNTAREQACVVFTHDLDFGNILAVTGARGPSVIQVRTQNPVPETIGKLLLAALATYSEYLKNGALVTVEPGVLRARILPLLPGAR